MRQVEDIGRQLIQRDLRQYLDRPVQADVTERMIRMTVDLDPIVEVRIKQQAIDFRLDAKILGIPVNIRAPDQQHRPLIHQAQDMILTAHLGNTVEAVGCSRMVSRRDLAFTVHRLAAQMDQSTDPQLLCRLNDFCGAPVIRLSKVMGILVGIGPLNPGAR